MIEIQTKESKIKTNLPLINLICLFGSCFGSVSLFLPNTPYKSKATNRES